MEDRQIVLLAQQGPQGNDVLHFPARSLYGGLKVPEYLVELVHKLVAHQFPLPVQRHLASDDDQAIKGLEVNAEGLRVNRHSSVFVAHRLVNPRGLNYLILHRLPPLFIDSFYSLESPRGLRKSIGTDTKSENATQSLFPCVPRSIGLQPQY